MPPRHAIHLHLIGNVLRSFSLPTADGRPRSGRILAVTEVVSYAAALAVSSVKSSENSYGRITSRENARDPMCGWALQPRRHAATPPGTAVAIPLERCDKPAIYLVLQPTP